MTKKIEIKIVIEPPLTAYFEEGINNRDLNISAAEGLTEFLTTVLNNSLYPIVSSKTGPQEIHLNYRPRSFADPIF
ncbi:hypothetical protein SAMN05660420_00453 [Desulfuromusa kysingii]|uniref:Uncharacterized protein n=1 Tax=Desulfuromusa kysingii TaxID=37625 RepID=A0A1H3W3I8_9BACT|nr:hypothetical protein SAMN05660420_00453 [Desulfuromusa kysingii]